MACLATEVDVMEVVLWTMVGYTLLVERGYTLLVERGYTLLVERGMMAVLGADGGFDSLVTDVILCRL